MITETLYVENFGPIVSAEISIKKVTLLVGRQGSGKSTMAKLYSLFTWIEKSLIRHTLLEKDLTQNSKFRKKYCSFNGIDDYFSESTVLRFNGLHYNFIYESGQLHIEERDEDNSFIVSKVMYVPAERSILGSVDHPSLLKGLNSSMVSFSEEYSIAKSNIKSGYVFPFDQVNFEYDALNDMSKIKLGSGKELKLSAGSSGFQSSLPLLLVSKNLSQTVQNSSGKSDLSEKERVELQKMIEHVFSQEDLIEDVKTAWLHMISSRIKYSRFVNIVEEMELNLFPDSQKAVLYELIADTQLLDRNMLFMTTHSPYVINYLTIAIKAKELYSKALLAGKRDLADMITEIVPEQSQISASDIAIHELEDGYAKVLSDYNGIPSDDNFLNNSLQDTNICFDRLLEIEDGLQ